MRHGNPIDIRKIQKGRELRKDILVTAGGTRVSRYAEFHTRQKHYS